MAADPDVPRRLVGPDGLDRVERQVEEHLLELAAVGVDRGEVLRQIDVDLDPARRDAVRLKSEHALDERRDRSWEPFARSLAGEVEQVLDDVAGAVRLLDQQPRVVTQVGGQALVAEDQLAEGHDRRERVVELVGDAGYELADRLHLLGLEQLLLEPLLIGQVANQDHVPPVAPDLDAGHLDLFGKRAAVGPEARIAEGAVALALHDLEAPAPLDGAPAPGPGCHIGLERLEVGVVQLQGRAVRGNRDAVERQQDDGVGRLLEEDPIALFGSQEALAETELGQRDPGNPADDLEDAGGVRQLLSRTIEVHDDDRLEAPLDANRNGRP